MTIFKSAEYPDDVIQEIIIDSLTNEQLYLVLAGRLKVSLATIEKKLIDRQMPPHEWNQEQTKLCKFQEAHKLLVRSRNLQVI